MVLNSFPEISEKFILNQVIALLGAGVDLDIYPAHAPRNDRCHDLYERYGIADHVHYALIPRGKGSRLLGAIPVFCSLLFRNPRAAFRALDVRRYRTVAENCKLIYFASAFAGKEYDIVHCHFGMNGLVGAYLKDCGFARSLVATFHGSDINTYPSKHGQDVYRTLYERADLVTVNTSFTGGKVAANGCPEALIRVHPVGLIPQEYAGVGRDAVETHSILTVGRLVEKKGHEFLLRALPAVIAEYPDTVYRIAGDGHLRHHLEELASELGIKDHVSFLGQCTNDEVMAEYGRAAVFALPSVTAPDGDMEGQGLVLQEAQYCRVPVISTLHNGIPDGVLDGRTGFLVPEKDSVALSDRILRCFSRPDEAAAMGEAGRAFVSGRYDVERLAIELRGWYESLCPAK